MSQNVRVVCYFDHTSFAAMGTLELLRSRTADLVAESLRSDAAVISRLTDLIQEAVRLGHSHRSIHEAIHAGGLATTWTNYRISLGRARARKAVPTAQPNPVDAAAERPVVRPMTGSADRKEAMHPENSAAREGDVSNAQTFVTAPTSSTTEVLEALQRARRTAAAKDYGRIAREQLRQRTRQPLPDTPTKDSS
ncbi:hypothetical protein QTI66_32125 [Variovorax sp. J22R133]|uniref:hypothetical protein n=1 Tax=Variovorax brevis TaxID=3053503 RepID=UPI00257718E4|nr:hypothetical protein [Variovorax sp. J22R133]MDM0116785.1 hypothetical protein [Variovorax sp. J22R133]